MPSYRMREAQGFKPGFSSRDAQGFEAAGLSADRARLGATGTPALLRPVPRDTCIDVPAAAPHHFAQESGGEGAGRMLWLQEVWLTVVCLLLSAALAKLVLQIDCTRVGLAAGAAPVGHINGLSSTGSSPAISFRPRVTPLDPFRARPVCPSLHPSCSLAHRISHWSVYFALLPSPIVQMPPFLPPLAPPSPRSHAGVTCRTSVVFSHRPARRLWLCRRSPRNCRAGPTAVIWTAAAGQVRGGTRAREKIRWDELRDR